MTLISNPPILILTRLLGQQAQPDAGTEAVESALSLFDRIHSGGVIGYIIILLSFAAVALVVVHLVRIREQALAPQVVIDELDRLLSVGEVDKALELCEDQDAACFLTRVMGAGLSRYRRSPFGALELKGALEEAGQEQIGRLYRSTDAMALIAGISPMLGLLGTVVGLTGAFSTISQTEGFARPDQLAGDISLALITTILGLVVAIPVTAAVAYFRHRIDSLASEIAQVIDDLASHLEDSPPPAPSGSRQRSTLADSVPLPRPTSPGPASSSPGLAPATRPPAASPSANPGARPPSPQPAPTPSSSPSPSRP